MLATKILTCAVASLLGATLLTSPASAATRVKRDPGGDAPARIDLRRAAYTYGDGRVAVRARVPDLGRAGRVELSVTRFDVFEAGYVLRVVKRRDSPARVRLFFFDHFTLERRSCDDMTGRWSEEGVRMSVATECLTGHARRRVRLQVASLRGDDVDLAPAVRRLRRD